MRVNAITTGSSGNCYIIESFSKNNNQREYIILDCGVTYSNLLKHLAELEILITQIKYLIITHEHNDHIKGVETLLKNNPHTKIITSNSIIKLLKLNSLPNKIYNISYSQRLLFDSFDVFGFEITHDCEEAMGFIIIDKNTNKKICFMNDLGEYNEFHVQLVKQSDIIFLESNYDEKLVDISNMHPTYLNRLTSPKGHLSNSQAQQICSKCIRENQTIILTHISENMNEYRTCYEEMRKLINNLNIVNYNLLISYQNHPTGWIE